MAHAGSRPTTRATWGSPIGSTPGSGGWRPVPAVSARLRSAGGFVYAGRGLGVRKGRLAAGRLTTPAGVGSVGPLGDAGPAARAGVDCACGVAVDGSGNLVIADTLNQRVRVVAARTG